jgi:hypothetical protein
MNLESFKIRSVMLHDIPRGNEEDEAPTLTDAPIDLDTDLRKYFRGKIVTSLRDHGVEVVADTNEDDTVRTAVARVLGSSPALAAASRTIATRLDEVQTGRNPAGLLAVITGSVGNRPCVSVLKLEREQGLRFRIRQVEGRRIVDLEFLRDLTLTDKTKVFKTSLFIAKGGARASSIVGRVSDDQRGSQTMTGVANFFLNTFLGCRLKDNPEKATLQFVQAFDGFVNDEVTSADKRGRYQVALLAAMQSQTTAIRPRSFANANLEPADRPSFLDHVREGGLNPDTPFSKDLSLVKVSGFKMTFESGMVLVGSKDDLSERVDIRPDDAPRAGVEINDAVEKLRGR